MCCVCSSVAVLYGADEGKDDSLLGQDDLLVAADDAGYKKYCKCGDALLSELYHA